MIKEIKLKDKIIQYDLSYKNVKNINLRIRADASISVSANKSVKEKYIEDFIVSKQEFILNALKRIEANEKSLQRQYYTESEVKEVILGICKNAYLYYEKRGIKYPQIKFRTMVSRWGSCNTQKEILTFNTNLMFAPFECIEYVVLHEFTHFLQANHSNKFYCELAKVCPNWKMCQNKLREIRIR